MEKELPRRIWTPEEVIETFYELGLIRDDCEGPTTAGMHALHEGGLADTLSDAVVVSTPLAPVNRN